MKKTTSSIDEGLYSRQLYVYGHEVMENMNNTSVLISGCGGLGVEIAKNVILSGIKNVTIHDTKFTQQRDLSTQYYLTSDDIGKNRAEACYHKLTELNSYVDVTVCTKPLTKIIIKKYNIIVLTEALLEEQLRINNYTHSHGIKFINGTTWGLFGQIFCDFGEGFVVKDVNGERLNTGVIKHISNEKNALVTTTKPHHLTTDNLIKMTNIKGLYELNNKEFLIKYISPTSFTIECDTIKLQSYDNSSNAELTQVKVSKTINFEPLRKSIKNPEFLHVNFLDYDRPNLLHALYQAYFEWIYNKPNPTMDDIDEFIIIVQKYKYQINKDKINKKIVKKFIHCLEGNICPMQSIIGGTIAQEVVKACSGKFHPIKQWMYFDAYECIPNDYEKKNYQLSNNYRSYEWYRIFIWCGVCEKNSRI